MTVRTRTLLGWGAAALVLLFVQGPALLEHMRRSLNPLVYNDDVRIIIFPFFRYSDPELFRNDFVSDYFLAGLPEGFRTVYWLAAKLWDAAAFSKLLPYLLVAVTLGALAVAARRVGGNVAAFGVAALSLGTGVFLARMAGGLPRAFAYPVLAIAAAALALGKPRWLAAAVWLGALFYPVVGVISGLSLALLLACPASERGEASDWSPRRRLIFVGVVGIVAAALVVPCAIRLRGFGAELTPNVVAQYPEIGPGGRFGAEDRAPFPGFFESAGPLARDSISGIGDPWWSAGASLLGGRHQDRRQTFFVVLLIVVVAGWVRLALRGPEARRVLLLAAAAFLGQIAARAVTPRLFLPQRYVQYSVPVLAILFTATAFAGFAPTRGEHAPKWRAALCLVGNLALLALLGGRGRADTGLTIAVRPGEATLLREIRKLPKHAVVAGWPRAAIDDVPYVARRTVFMSFETHMPYHRGYTDSMRRRMNALIAAYFGTSPEPLRRLRDEFGVTHLIVYPSYLRGRPPSYFRPFDGTIRNAIARANGQKFELERQLPVASVFTQTNTALLDLSRLAP